MLGTSSASTARSSATRAPRPIYPRRGLLRLGLALFLLEAVEPLRAHLRRLVLRVPGGIRRLRGRNSLLPTGRWGARLRKLVGLRGLRCAKQAGKPGARALLRLCGDVAAVGDEAGSAGSSLLLFSSSTGGRVD